MSVARPRTVGHRGASALAPENTLLSVRLAAEHGLELVEVDVYLSRDRELMVVHDEDLRRVAGRPERIDALSADELARVDVGAGQGVPRLADVLDLARRHRLGIYIELKGEQTGAALGQLARAGGTRDVEVIAGSFDIPLVAELRQAVPDIPRSVLFRRTDVATMREVCASVGATYAHPCFRPLDSALVDELHRAGLRVMAPHTNDPIEATVFADAGIDVLATDDPAVLLPLAAR